MSTVLAAVMPGPRRPVELRGFITTALADAEALRVPQALVDPTR